MAALHFRPMAPTLRNVIHAPGTNLLCSRPGSGPARLVRNRPSMPSIATVLRQDSTGRGELLCRADASSEARASPNGDAPEDAVKRSPSDEVLNTWRHAHVSVPPLLRQIRHVRTERRNCQTEVGSDGCLDQLWTYHQVPLSHAWILRLKASAQCGRGTVSGSSSCRRGERVCVTTLFT